MTKEVKLNYISPVELEAALKTNKLLDDKNMLMTKNNSVHFIFNNSTNQIMLTGDSLSITDALQMVAFLDVPPRQIVIEAKIIEVDNQRINQLGIDWQYLLDKVSVNPYYDITESKYETDLRY
jgi:type II secretory pathway component GspD/PulD (secretin)